MPRNVAVLVGSLRRESFSRQLANAAATLALESLKLSIVEIGALTHYDQDAEADPPQAWRAFRDEVRAADALLFVTPEYNRSVPGVLKNAIDVGSRPYGHSVWNAKPGAVISNSPGTIGGFGANQHLRQSLVFLNVPTMQMPEAYIGGVAGLFDADGQLQKDDVGDFLLKFMTAFAAWVELILAR